MPKDNEYKVGDCVWVKLKGFPHWPARIDKIENKKYTMFYFGTHEIGLQKQSTLLPFTPYRDKYALYRGACPKVLLEGVLEAEVNPGAKPDDQLSNLNSDTQIWMVMGKEGQEDFTNRFPKRAKKAQLDYELYTKEMKLERLKAGKDPDSDNEMEKSIEDKDSEKSSTPIIGSNDNDMNELASNENSVAGTKTVECNSTAANMIKESCSSKERINKMSDYGDLDDELTSECSQDSEIEVTMNVPAVVSDLSDDGKTYQPSRGGVVLKITRSNRAPDKLADRLADIGVSSCIRSKGVGRNSWSSSLNDERRIERSRNANKLKLTLRKRINSETVTSLEPRRGPPRKKRRTQSETVLLGRASPDPSSSPSSSLASSAPSSPAHSSGWNDTGSTRRGSMRSKNASIAELDHCLRYSLRKSHLNENAANLILDDIEKLNISSTDCIDNLVTSLTLVTTLEKLPEIKKRSSRILSELGRK